MILLIWPLPCPNLKTRFVCVNFCHDFFILIFEQENMVESETQLLSFSCHLEFVIRFCHLECVICFCHLAFVIHFCYLVFVIYFCYLVFVIPFCYLVFIISFHILIFLEYHEMWKKCPFLLLILSADFAANIASSNLLNFENFSWTTEWIKTIFPKFVSLEVLTKCCYLIAKLKFKKSLVYIYILWQE